MFRVLLHIIITCDASNTLCKYRYVIFHVFKPIADILLMLHFCQWFTA